jgi:glycerate kinase
MTGPRKPAGIVRRPAPPCILLAPSGFKEGPDARAVIAHMARGVAAAAPDARILRAPMVDGGEGFTETIVEIAGGSLHRVGVTGPLGQSIEAVIGLIGGRGGPTGIVEVAAAAGLRLVPPHQRDPRRTTSYGVGELIRAALDLGARRLIVGCGDSGINDGGAGMAQALGIRFEDSRGRSLAQGGGALAQLARIDTSARDPRLGAVRIEAAVNWENSLLGVRGVSRVYGPQKGATPLVAGRLDRALTNFARVVRRDLGIDVATLPGAGASGGVGAGLHAFLGARLRPRFDVVTRFVALDRLLAEADLVLTAEGRIDGQTALGKVPAEVARRAKRHGLPVIALAGAIGPGARATLQAGIDAYLCVLNGPGSLAEAMERAPELIAAASEQAVRLALAVRHAQGRPAAKPNTRRPRQPQAQARCLPVRGDVIPRSPLGQEVTRRSLRVRAMAATRTPA